MANLLDLMALPIVDEKGKATAYFEELFFQVVNAVGGESDTVLSDLVSANATAIALNASNIGDNVTSIATNVADIATNASAIAANTAEIEFNRRYALMLS